MGKIPINADTTNKALEINGNRIKENASKI